jgi:NitT/TauT family transport system substrate-binding protein
VNIVEWVTKNIAQFGVGNSELSLKSRIAGADIVILAQVFQRSGSLGVALADKVKTIGDLRGKTVEMWDGHDDEFRVALIEAGLNITTDINRITQNFSPLGLLQGRSDCVMATTYNELPLLLEYVGPNATQLNKLEKFTIFSFEDLGTAVVQDSLIVSSSWLSNPYNQDIARRFLRAITRGWIFCRDSLEQCVKLFWSGDDHQRWMMNEVNKLIWGTGGTFGLMNKTKWDNTVDILSKTGIIPAGNYSDTYDMTLMSQVVLELQAEGVAVHAYELLDTNFSWCLRSASCPGASSTAYICTGAEKS